MTLTTFAEDHATQTEDNRVIDVSVADVKRLILWAMKNYNEACKHENKYGQAYYDGYIRGLRHLLEMVHE